MLSLKNDNNNNLEHSEKCCFLMIYLILSKQIFLKTLVIFEIMSILRYMDHPV